MSGQVSVDTTTVKIENVVSSSHVTFHVVTNSISFAKTF